MSFNAQDFSVLAYANGFTHWHYRSKDSLAQVTEAGYFAAAHDMLRPGDQITVNLTSEKGVGLAALVVAGIAPGKQVDLALMAATPQPRAVACAA